MKRKPRLTCPACGTEYSEAMEFCPVCILRSGLASEIKADEPASEDTLKPTIERRAQRFEHYELVRGDDGRPVELGRGAMGVTYRAMGRLEVNLALQIAKQVAAGLAALHKQNLVHRDIKPSNIMVSLEEADAATAKIIDLGLAKAVHEAGSANNSSTSSKIW